MKQHREKIVLGAVAVLLSLLVAVCGSERTPGPPVAPPGTGGQGGLGQGGQGGQPQSGGSAGNGGAGISGDGGPQAVDSDGGVNDADVSDTTPIPNACPRTVTPAAAGNGKKLGFAFRKVVDGNNTFVQNSLAVTADRIAVAGDYELFFLDRQGERVGKFSNPTLAPLSPPVADDAGNFYVVSDQALAFSPKGQVLWSTSVPGRSSGERVFPRAPLLSRNGVLVTVQDQNAGQAAGFEATTGKVSWHDTIAGGKYAYLGFRESFIVSSVGPSPVRIFDVRSGRPQFQLSPERGDWSLPYGAAKGFGLFRSDEVGGAGVPVTVHDFDGKKRWAFPRPSGANHRIDPRFVDLDGWLVATDARYDDSANGFLLRRFDCNGNEGPSTRVVLGQGRSLPYLFIVGADGLTYAFAHRERRDGFDGFGVYAFDRDWKEVFRHEIDSVETSTFASSAPAALAEDGMLYFLVARRYSDANPSPISDLVGIQTPSPGIAPTAWPTYRHDKEGRGWLRD